MVYLSLSPVLEPSTSPQLTLSFKLLTLFTPLIPERKGHFLGALEAPGWTMSEVTQSLEQPLFECCACACASCALAASGHWPGIAADFGYKL